MWRLAAKAALPVLLLCQVGCHSQPFLYAPPPATHGTTGSEALADSAAQRVEQPVGDSGVNLAAYSELPSLDTESSGPGWSLEPLPQDPAIDAPWDLSLHQQHPAISVWQDIAADHRNYYSFDNLTLLGVGSGAAAAMANTNVDDFISNDLYQENVRTVSTDEYFEAIHSMKLFGEGAYALPLYATTVMGSWIARDNEYANAMGRWGERSLRTILVGAPPMLAMQRIVGASRPGEADSESQWRPFQDDNGVSGHSFMGAVPFLTAAEMMENPWMKGGLYLGSGMAGLSRINDNDHYASQVALGWWMAYLAARSVARTEIASGVSPVVQTSPSGFTGLSFEKTW